MNSERVGGFGMIFLQTACGFVVPGFCLGFAAFICKARGCEDRVVLGSFGDERLGGGG